MYYESYGHCKTCPLCLSTTGRNEWNRWAAAIFCTSRPSRLSRGKPFYRPSNCRDDRRFPSNGASAYGRVLSISSQYAEVTDKYPEVVMSSIQKEYPWCGNRQMCGHLLARGLRVQQHRVREIQRKIDPNGSI